MKRYIIGKTKLISYICTALVGFCIGVGANKLGLLALIIAFILDAVTKYLTYRIEQNKNTAPDYEKRRQL